MIAARPAGDAALLVEAPGTAPALAAAVRAGRLPGVLDAVPGAQTVLVTTEPGSCDLGALAGLVGALPVGAAGAGQGGLAEFPVVYDGADLAEVAALTGLTPGGVAAAHQAASYTVGWMGFSPGFGYLTGLDPALRGVPRLPRPRVSVPAGSVAIAGGLAAVYPAALPGGWRLLGRTSARLWDPWREPPALLTPGMRVRFRAVRELPADAAGPTAAGPTPAAAAQEPAGRPVHPRFNNSRWPAPAIEVLRPGPLATIQDLGRPGFGHLGVPAGGAADPASLRLANRLAGNPGGAAGIELTLGRARLRFLAGALVAVAGAPVPLTVGPGSGGPGSPADFGAPLPVRAGSVLHIGAPPTGLRSYLAVGGGIDAPAVLGSRSADLLSGVGPPPLRAGDLLAVAAGAPARSGHPPLPAPALPPADGPALLHLVAGPRDDWFDPAALRTLGAASYTVTAASNRTGLRLDGPVLPRSGAAELPPEGIATGSLQVPPDGLPILLLADHPVTGGYPVIAVVRSADIGLAAQLRPGQRVRFAVSR